MRHKDALSLDEFALGTRKQSGAVMSVATTDAESPVATSPASNLAKRENRATAQITEAAEKPLRQGAGMRAANHFVNVNLDRDTKRRLKFASFNMDTTMQAIMETAIRQYLDASGY